MKKILFLILLFNLSISCMDNSKSDLDKKHESEEVEHATSQDIKLSLLQELKDLEEKYSSDSTLEREEQIRKELQDIELREREIETLEQNVCDIAKAFEEIGKNEYVKHHYRNLPIIRLLKEKQKVYQFLSNKDNFNKFLHPMLKDINSLIYQYLGLFSVEHKNSSNLWFTSSNTAGFGFSSDGKYLASHFRKGNNNIAIRKLSTEKNDYNIDNFLSLNEYCYGLLFSNNGKYLATKETNNSLDFSKITDKLNIFSFEQPSGNKLLNIIRRKNDIKKIIEISTGNDRISSMSFHPKETFFAFCTLSGGVVLFDFDNKKLIPLIKGIVGKYRDTIAKFSFDGKLLFIVLDGKPEINIFNLENGGTKTCIVLDKLAQDNHIFSTEVNDLLEINDSEESYQRQDLHENITLGTIKTILPSSKSNDLIIYTQNRDNNYHLNNSRLLRVNIQTNEFKNLFLDDRDIICLKFTPDCQLLIAALDGHHYFTSDFSNDMDRAFADFVQIDSNATELLIISSNTLERLSKIVLNTQIHDLAFADNGQYLITIDKKAKVDFYKTSLR